MLSTTPVLLVKLLLPVSLASIVGSLSTRRSLVQLFKGILRRWKWFTFRVLICHGLAICLFTAAALASTELLAASWLISTTEDFLDLRAKVFELPSLFHTYQLFAKIGLILLIREVVLNGIATWLERFPFFCMLISAALRIVVVLVGQRLLIVRANGCHHMQPRYVDSRGSCFWLALNIIIHKKLVGTLLYIFRRRVFIIGCLVLLFIRNGLAWVGQYWALRARHHGHFTQILRERRRSVGLCVLLFMLQKLPRNPSFLFLRLGRWLSRGLTHCRRLSNAR